MNSFLYTLNIAIQSIINYQKDEIYRLFIIESHTRENPKELRDFTLSLFSKKEFEKHPNDYWAEKYNDRPFLEDVFDAHVCFWYKYSNYIKDLVNKISLLSSDKNFREICKKFSEDIEKVFYVAPGYKKSQKSNWFQNSQSYREFLENRENLKPNVKELFDNFEKDVEKYLGDKQ